MNNIKKAVFGVLVAGLAFGFSAFTIIKKRNIWVYYKVDLTYPDASDPRGYRYYSDDRCEAGGDLCSAQWDIGANLLPVDGDALPIAGVTFQTGFEYGGHFE